MKNKIKFVCVLCIIKVFILLKLNYVVLIFYFFDNIYIRIIKVVKLLRGVGFCMIVKDDVLSKNIILIFRVIFKIFNKMEDVRCVVMLDF